MDRSDFVGVILRIQIKKILVSKPEYSNQLIDFGFKNNPFQMSQTVKRRRRKGTSVQPQSLVSVQVGQCDVTAVNANVIVVLAVVFFLDVFLFGVACFIVFISSIVFLAGVIILRR